MKYVLIISLIILSLQCSREPYKDQKEKLTGKWSRVTESDEIEYVFKKNGKYTKSDNSISYFETGEYEFLGPDFIKLQLKFNDSIENDSLIYYFLKINFVDTKFADIAQLAQCKQIAGKKGKLIGSTFEILNDEVFTFYHDSVRVAGRIVNGKYKIYYSEDSFTVHIEDDKVDFFYHFYDSLLNAGMHKWRIVKQQPA